MTYKALDIAKWFLSKDVDKTLFNKELTSKNGRTFYEGNARLNKFLHLAQNIHIAKYGKPLFNERFYAYDNGAVVEDVRTNYAVLLNKKENNIAFDEETEKFLNKFFSFFKNASVDELIELSHEDNEWKEKTKNFRKSDQIMDSMNLARVAEYKEQYEDIVEAMEQLNPHTSYSSEYIDISRLDVIGYRNEDGNYILPKEYDEDWDT